MAITESNIAMPIIGCGDHTIDECSTKNLTTHKLFAVFGEIF